MPGPLPKDPAIRQRRNKVTTQAILVVQDAPRVRAPQLPELPKKKCKVKGQVVEIEQAWHPMAEKLWKEIWASPMRYEFLRADEGALFRLIFLVHLFWTKGSLAVAAEIRMLEREFGLTPLSRRRLQWMVAHAEEAKDQHLERKAKRAAASDAIVDVGDPRGVLES